MLPASWETTRLTISDGNLEEAKILRQIFNACSYVEPWDESLRIRSRTSSQLEQLIQKSVLSGVKRGAVYGPKKIRNSCSGEVIGRIFGLRHGSTTPFSRSD